MAVCKKCGKNLKKTNIVLSVESSSVAAQNEISKGDVIVAVDGKPVKSKDEIESALRDKTECKINISHKDQTKTISISEAKDFLKGIDFTAENTCSSCGAKQKKSKVPLVIALILIILISGISVVLLKSGKNSIEDFDGDIEIDNKDLSSKGLIDSNTTIMPDSTTGGQKLTPAGTINPSYYQEQLKALGENNPKLAKVINELIDEFDGDFDVNERKLNSNILKDAENTKIKLVITKLIKKNSNGNDLSTLEHLKSFMDPAMSKIVSIEKFPYGYPKVDNINKELPVVDKQIIAVLSQIPEEYLENTYVLLEGHTDTTSGYDFNLNLSRRRAEYIKNFIVKNYNIAPDKIITEGYSYSNLKYTPDDKNHPENQEKNRRVDLSIVIVE